MKKAEIRSADATPAVSALSHKMKRAGSRNCLCGVECFTLAWTAGLLTAFLYDLRIFLLLLAAGILAALRLTNKERLLLILGAVLGAAVWFRYDAAVRQPMLALDGKKVICTGKITNTRMLSQDRAVYTLHTSLNSHRISIDWYADADTPPLEIGQIVTLDAELTRIPEDYRWHTAEYQAGMGKYLRIYRAELTDSEPADGFSLARLLHNYRQRITQQILAAMPEAEAGLLCAMLFGDKLMLPEDTAAAFRSAGIGHITVVSGLHLVFFCSVLAWLLRHLHLPAKWVCLLHIPAILLFILLADPSVSEARAAVMLMLSQSAALFGRKSDTLRSLCIAMFLCTITAPYVIGSVSFWLSVSGVFGIGVFAPYMTKNVTGSRLKKDFLSLCCVSAAIFPASVLLCGQSSLLAPVCNLLILPLCIAVIYFGFSLLLTGGLTGFLLPFAGILCRLIRIAAEFAARLPFSQAVISNSVVLTVIVLGCLFLLYLLFTGMPPKQLAAAMLGTAVLFAGLSLSSRILARQELRIAVLGGDKQAVLVISAEGQTIIADLTDTPRNAQYAARYLGDCGIRRTDILLLNGMRSMAGYQAELDDIQTEKVLLRNAGAWRADSVLCGKTPVFCNTKTVTLTEGVFSMRIADDITDLQWNGQHICICNASAEPDPDADTVIRYGDAPECSVQYNSISYSGNNFLLRFSADGGRKITSLYGKRGV